MSYSNMQGVKQVKLKLKIKRVDVERLLVMASAALVVALALRGNEGAVIRQEEALWEQGAATVAQPTLPPAEMQPVTVYYQDGEGYLVPVTARVEKTDGIAKAALRLLVLPACVLLPGSDDGFLAWLRPRVNTLAPPCCPSLR